MRVVRMEEAAGIEYHVAEGSATLCGVVITAGDAVREAPVVAVSCAACAERSGDGAPVRLVSRPRRTEVVASGKYIRETERFERLSAAANRTLGDYFDLAGWCG